MRIEESGPFPQPHGSSKVSLGMFWHVHYHRVGCVGINLCRVGVPAEKLPSSYSLICKHYLCIPHFLFRMFLANSMTAHWSPRQIPSIGIRFILAQWAAATLPSMPRVPKPPGISTPWQEQSCFHALWNLTAFLHFVSWKYCHSHSLFWLFKGFWRHVTNYSWVPNKRHVTLIFFLAKSLFSAVK